MAPNQPESTRRTGQENVEVGEFDVAHGRYRWSTQRCDEVRDRQLMAHYQYRTAGLPHRGSDGLGIGLRLLGSSNDLPLQMQDLKQRGSRQLGALLIGRDDRAEPGIAKSIQERPGSCLPCRTERRVFLRGSGLLGMTDNDYGP